jgi:hypothetical protein
MVERKRIPKNHLLGPTNAEIKDRTLQMHPDQKWREKKK